MQRSLKLLLSQRCRVLWKHAPNNTTQNCIFHMFEQSYVVLRFRHEHLLARLTKGSCFGLKCQAWSPQLKSFPVSCYKNILFCSLSVSWKMSRDLVKNTRFSNGRFPSFCCHKDDARCRRGSRTRISCYQRPYVLYVC